MRPRAPAAAIHASASRASLSSSASSSSQGNMRISAAPRSGEPAKETRKPDPLTLPILRWLNSPRHSPHSASPARTPRSSSPSPLPSPDPRIAEALTSELPLPRPPPTAHLRSLPNNEHSFRPPLFESLTRATLPTSSLSYSSPPPLYERGELLDHPYVNASPPIEARPGHDRGPSDYSIDWDTQPPASPIILSCSPPGRTSLDAVRTLLERAQTHPPAHRHTLSQPTPAHARPLHTTAASPSAWKSWFSGVLPDSKDEGETRHHEDVEDALKEAEAEGESYLAPEHPIVFCHGLLGFDSVTIGPAIAPLQVTHWRGITSALESHGIQVLITRVPATSSPIDRAQVLFEKIKEKYEGRKIHLIGHSMGGLDCRYLTTHLLPPPSEQDPERPYPFQVLSITTIATPHRGSYFADYFMETVGKERLPSVLGLLDMLPNGGGDGKAFEFLTMENMRKFNEMTPDVPGVKYFSWGAVYEPGFIDTWKFSHGVILEKEGPNDGLVSLASAKWGTYLGTLEHVNHLDLVGWINTARYKWAEIMGREIKFRPAQFYLGIADHLARVVEGKEGRKEERVERHGKDGDAREEGSKSPGTVQGDRERESMAESLAQGSKDGEVRGAKTRGSDDGSGPGPSHAS